MKKTPLTQLYNCVVFMYREKKSKGLVRKWMENGQKVTDWFFISFYSTGIQYRKR